MTLAVAILVVMGIGTTTSISSTVMSLLATKTYAQEIENGDTVEFTAGPFKGYKAKVLRVDDAKSDITASM